MTACNIPLFVCLVLPFLSCVLPFLLPIIDAVQTGSWSKKLWNKPTNQVNGFKLSTGLFQDLGHKFNRKISWLVQDVFRPPCVIQLSTLKPSSLFTNTSKVGLWRAPYIMCSSRATCTTFHHSVFLYVTRKRWNMGLA